jgi:integrase
MVALIFFLLNLVASPFKPKSRLEAESNLRLRPAKPALGRGRLQTQVRRAFTVTDAPAISASQVYDWCYARRRLVLGKPYGGNAFSEQFRNWCDAAGLPKHCSAHGLRKAACRRLAEHGCSANEIMAISGHTTMKEIVRYTVAADQARLARNAMNRSQNLGGNATSTPARQ